jgi:hypothetical protein
MSTYAYQTSAFTPTQISGCQLWLDASTATNFTFSSTSNISSWLDRSGSNNNFTAFNTPTHDSTNKRVRFTSASSEYMSNAVMNYNLSQRTIFIVMEEITNSLACGILSFVPNPNTGNDYQTTNGMTVEGNNGMRFYMNSSGYWSDIGGPNPLTKQIYCDRMATTTGSGFVNGSNVTNVTANFTAGTSVGMLIGARWGGMVQGPYLNGYIYEILLYNSALSASDRQAIEGYLAWKWNLNSSLIATSPYKTRAPSFLTPFTRPIVSLPNPLFVPMQYSNCVLWLDAADRSTLFQDTTGQTPCYGNGQRVALWRDKSSQANHASNTSAWPSLSTNFLNGKNVVNFVGASNNYLLLDSTKLPTGSTNFTYFFVTRTSLGTTQVFFSYGAALPITNQYPQFYYNASTNLVYDLFGGSAISDGTAYSSSWVVHAATGGSTFNGYDYGATFSVTNNLNITLATGTGFAAIGISKIGGGALAFPFTGQIAEMIGYSRILTTTERQNIEGYLAWKWGLATNLDSAQPWKSVRFHTLPPFPNVTLSPITVQQRWQPTQLANLTLWLDAADRASLTFSGTSVTQWRDKSGLANHGSNVGTIVNDARINGVPAMFYPGLGSTYFTGTLANSGTTMSAFSVFVMNTSSYNVARVLSLSRTGFNDFNNTLYTAAIQRSGANFITYRANADRGAIAGTFAVPSLFGTIYTGASNTVYLNGTAGTTVASSGSFGYSNYEVGGSFGEESLVPLNGSVGEIIHYNGALTTAQRERIEGYLAWKWRLVANLPASHPYKLFPPVP